jgi:prevent-host-death family protein
MGTTLNVAGAKRRLSELMSRVAYKGERFLIKRRSTPMVALVSAEDLSRLERQSSAGKGLLAALAHGPSLTTSTWWWRRSTGSARRRRIGA